MSSENGNKSVDVGKILEDLSAHLVTTSDFSKYGLASLFARPEARGLYYSGQKVTLDGYSFVNCRFDNCVLEVTSTNFDLIQCVIDPSTTITYGSTVMKIIQLFNSRYEWAYQHFPSFVPIRHANGSITISDRVA